MKGRGGTEPLILKLGIYAGSGYTLLLTRFTPRKKPPVPYEQRRLSGPQSQSGGFGETRTLLPVRGIESRSFGHPGSSLVTTQTMLPWYPM